MFGRYRCRTAWLEEGPLLREVAIPVVVAALVVELANCAGAADAEAAGTVQSVRSMALPNTDLSISFGTTNEIDREQQLKAYMRAASASLGGDQIEALSKISDEARRDLAMTYYLRAKSIGERWSWSSDRIKAYENSAERAGALAEMAKIATRFSAENFGFIVRASTRIRSLDEQIALWASVSSVAESALELRSAALTELSKPSYGKDPDDASTKRFRNFLDTWRASHWPTVMAPGLSLHGRGRAYDFQIYDQAGKIVADNNVSSIKKVWDGEGWTEKLSLAVHAASSRFVGPMQKPYEPWHYEYQPE